MHARAPPPKLSSCGQAVCTRTAPVRQLSHLTVAVPNTPTVSSRPFAYPDTRFLGLSRFCGTGDQDHVRNIYLREMNMLRAIEQLSISDSTRNSSRAETTRVRDSSSEEQEPAGNCSEAGTSAAGSGCEGAGSPSGAGEPVRIPTSRRLNSSVPVCTVVPAKSAGGSGAVAQETRVEACAKQREEAVGCASVADAPSGGVFGWKRPLPATLGSTARKYAVQYLATCVRQALNKNPDMMSRCAADFVVVVCTCVYLFRIYVFLTVELCSKEGRLSWLYFMFVCFFL